ncbi:MULTISPECIES: nuclear transport factor 2 family protein [unclassified Iodobacter]|uniref:nuclear transport factor 2 family protein n=1 Tax=unclassified Iodobacter TaxID=235634 RepID=UPI0025E1A407|nr:MULTISPECIES: nuclear transport factor 2 family protein [unclassified Iodobacter]MDW5416098.1 nuclear transport factor 2 family protein [Iodobacter sp. CM08]
MKKIFVASVLMLSTVAYVQAAPPASGVEIQTITNAIDSMDPAVFAKLLTENARFKFGNFPEAQGKAAIYQAQVDFFKSVKGVKHRVIKEWQDKDSILAQMEVTYTRHDGSEITLPVTDIFNIRNGKVDGTYIYMDVAPLYQPPK